MMRGEGEAPSLTMLWKLLLLDEDLAIAALILALWDPGQEIVPGCLTWRPWANN